MGRAAIYCRISSDREGRALGIDRQEQDCRMLAERLNHQAVTVFVDNDVSAGRTSKKRRPQFEEMISLAEAGHFDAIISWSTSRLTRRPMEHERLIPLFEEKQITISTVKAGDHDYTTARGRRRARDDAARDAEEVEEAAERIKRQKIQAASSGLWRGGRRPYGYGAHVGVDERTGKAILDCNRIVPEEAREVAEATRAVLAGASLRSLAVDMNARGCATATGRSWTGTELRKVLRRARNAGLVEVTQDDGSSEVVAKACWPAIVREEEWRGVVAILDDPGRRTNQSNVARRWLGSGLFVCGVCGGTVKASLARTNGGGLMVYRCHKKSKQGEVHANRRADYVDEIVTKAVLGRLARRDIAGGLRRRKNMPDVTLLQAEATTLRARLGEADDMFASGELDRRRLAKITADVRAKLADVEAKLAQATSTGPLAGIVGAPDLQAAWEALDVSRRQAVVEALCEVVLQRGRKGRPAGWVAGGRYFDPESVQVRWRRD